MGQQVGGAIANAAQLFENDVAIEPALGLRPDRPEEPPDLLRQRDHLLFNDVARRCHLPLDPSAPTLRSAMMISLLEFLTIGLAHRRGYRCVATLADGRRRAVQLRTPGWCVVCNNSSRGKHLIRQTFAVTVAFSVFLSGCASGRFGPDPDTEAPKGPHTLKKLSVAERQALLQRAQVWQAIDTSSLNLIAGPVAAGRAARRPGRDVHVRVSRQAARRHDAEVPVRDQKGRRGEGEVRREERRGLRRGRRQPPAVGAGIQGRHHGADARDVPRLPAGSVCRQQRRLAARQPRRTCRRASTIPRSSSATCPATRSKRPDYEGWAWPELEAASETRRRRDARADRCVQAARRLHPALRHQARSAGDRLHGGTTERRQGQ